MGALATRWLIGILMSVVSLGGVYLFGYTRGTSHSAMRCQLGANETLVELNSIVVKMNDQQQRRELLLVEKQHDTGNEFDQIKSRLDAVSNDHDRDHCRLSEYELREIWNSANKGFSRPSDAVKEDAG